MTMHTVLKIEIDTRNEGIQSMSDVAECLSKVVNRIDYGYESGSVLDANGNSIGEYVCTITEEEDE